MPESRRAWKALAAVGASGPALAVARVPALVQQQALPLLEEAQALAAVVHLGCYARPPPHEGRRPSRYTRGARRMTRTGHSHTPRLSARVRVPTPVASTRASQCSSSGKPAGEWSG